jgi:hypothetical protein
MRSISVAERRARLARRQHLAPDARAAGVEQAARSLVALHATTPSSVYLSAWARIEGFRLATMDAALYEERRLVKHLAMRRTLFVFPVDALPAAQAGASARVARAEAGRLVREVEKAGLHLDGSAWLEKAKHAVVEALEDGRELTSTQLREEIPLLEGAVVYGVGKKWGREIPVGPRVLTVLSAEGRVVRATNDGAWTVSRPRWTSMAAWTGSPLPEVPERTGVAELVRGWLAAFGPGTVRDIAWWLGGTLTATRRALADVGAVEVDLDGATGFVLPDDLEPTDPVEPWAALLPELDPTTMGWAERDWYLGAHRAEVFDTNGNGGNTAWWQGRIVGGWAQSPAGEVVLHLLEDVGRDGRRALEAEAARLSDWFAGLRVTGRYPSPLVTRAARGTTPEGT